MNFTEMRLKIKHFIKKNRRLFIIIFLIWAIIFLINMLLGLRKVEPTATTTYEPHVAVMDSSKSTPKSMQKPIEEKIKEYVESCNDGNYEKAYSMISEECKKYEFNDSIGNFMRHVYVKMPLPKKYFIQDYSLVQHGSRKMYIYDVKYTDDYLATGLTNDEYKYSSEKFSFYKDNDGNMQMNIGDFLYYSDVKKISENEYLKIDVESKIVEYEVERYNIRFKNKSNYTIVVSDNYENNEVILKLSEEVRKREETSNIVLKPGEEFNTEATFSKYSDDGDDSQSIMFSSVRIMENYSGIENVDEETIKNEIDNAIKMSMEVKIAK